ncbi:uncharacterized protein LOC129966395 [Argiope bruennichi]|uniref:uncharacterized protein LOC129966395 n=1 Tax=Argiope bruennichi TaxID=94029 RepID=UPI002495377A|nr:uncharacterized protein LOC129966395 [Argiope bruennichi]
MIPVLNSKYVSSEQKEKGKIILKSAFGERINATLSSFQISLKDKNNEGFSRPIEIVAAVTDRIQEQFIIPPSVLNLLGESINHSRSQNTSGLEAPMEESFDEFMICCGISQSEEQPSGNESDSLDKKNKINALKEEQRKCDTLLSVRKNLSLGKGNFFMNDELIFHRDKILGEKVNQLVLPKNKRQQVLKLAHESIFGCHMGLKKTSERIKYSFYWPNMTDDIKNFCKSCKECQLRSPEKMIDKIPITPVLRPELPFEIVNIDLIGPIEPPSARRHKYVLCLMDQHSRWPEAIPLRSLTAKATCDALLEIFMRTGIPNVIASDNGTNFISKLTQEFMKRLGCAPRFTTPNHPAGNGLIERYNRVFKNSLHHIIRTDPSNWDKYIPYMLFAYREVPNCTTGVSPFKLMYGREARGPLSVLKSSWCGDIAIPLNMEKSVVDYLQEQKINLERAAEEASLIASGKQQAYAEYFNRRTASKEFKPGDQVYLLIPDSSNKLYARWTGPGEVIEHCPPHSYKIKLSDGKIRHCHANKIRKYYPRINAVGMIFEDDADFGEVYSSPSYKNVCYWKEIFDQVDLRHLSEEVKCQILNLLWNHHSIFTGQVRVAKVGHHKIKLEDDKERKKPYVYRIPEALKPQIDSQIEELLKLDLIEESSADIAYPIVCVNKKDGSIRMCVDYRALNAVTKTDDFPMEDATELIYSIGQANVISVLDLLKGYYSLPMEEDSRDYTSFKTHRAQYRFKVMPFGLKNAAATFQREMNKALSPYREFCRAYIDDIAIFSNDISSHLKHLHLVLDRLEELQFTVNLSKCAFAKSEISYLGHIIGSGKHQADPAKLETISRLPVPETKKQLRSALGLFNYYRDYIANFAEIAFPLTELTKKRSPDVLPWCEMHSIAFEKLKSALLHAPTLHTPNMSKPFVIHCDASSIGIGSCLSQTVDGNMCPIAYASQKLNKSQQSWSTIEREAFAIVWSLKKVATDGINANKQ